MSWENLFMPYANNKGADKPAHPRSLISTFVVHCLDSIISLVSISEISSLQLTSVAAQAGLSLTWSKTLKTGFLVIRLKSVSLQSYKYYINFQCYKYYINFQIGNELQNRKESMDGWVRVFSPFLQYFSHFKMMEGWTWKALCNQALFRFGKNLKPTNPWSEVRSANSTATRALPKRNVPTFRLSCSIVSLLSVLSVVNDLVYPTFGHWLLY